MYVLYMCVHRLSEYEYMYVYISICTQCICLYVFSAVILFIFICTINHIDSCCRNVYTGDFSNTHYVHN